MSKIVGGSVGAAGCGDDVISPVDLGPVNIEHMAIRLESRPPTDADRRQLVDMLRGLADMVGGFEAASSDSSPASSRADETSPQ